MGNQWAVWDCILCRLIASLGVGGVVLEDLVDLFRIEFQMSVSGIPVVEGLLHEAAFVSLRADGDMVLADVAGVVAAFAEQDRIGFFPCFR